MARQDDGFRAFVADAEQDLLGTALLLTGDPTAADDLLVAALARTHRRWRRLDSPDAARADTLAALVAGSLGRIDLPAPGPQVARLDGDTGLAPADRGWLQALGALDPRSRAVVVLRLRESWDDDGVAALLECPPATVAAALADAVRTLAPLLLPAPAAGRPAEAPEPAAALPAAPVVPALPADDDAYAIYRRTGTPAPRPPSPRPTPVPVGTPSTAPADGDPYAIYRRPR